MAIFSYECKEHGAFKVYLDKREKSYKCPICEKECFPIIKKIGTTRSVETIDTGFMAKAVERLSNIDEIIKERNANAKEEQIELIGKELKEEEEENNN